MTSIKTAKRALIFSVLATFLCVAMLVGTTFAWFTDSAVTSVNKIQAGKLLVDLEMATEWNEDGSVKTWVSAKGKTLEFKKVGAAEDGNVLWEPGCTYKLPELRVVNKGDLALKYKVIISGIQGSAMLNKVIEWTMNGVEVGAEVSLAANETQVFTISGHMKEDAGNEYQGYAISGIAITVVATQNVEEAPYPVVGVDAEGTGTAIYNELNEKNPYILLGADANRYYGWFVKSSTTINLNKHSMTTKGSQSVLNVDGNGDLTVTGNGTLDASAGSSDVTVVTVAAGGKLTIESGTFVGKEGNSCIYNEGGTVVIKGGTFKGDTTKYLLNCKDGSNCVITVMGGTFYKFNPSSANAGEVVVAAGYHVVQDGDWYKVVAD